MRDIWVADCETDPFDGKTIVAPFIWGTMNIETLEYHQFYKTDDFVDFFENQNCIVYAHNGGKFDWHFILHRIAEETRLMIISGRLAKFKIGECEFRDSWNIIPMPLAAVQKTVVDYSIFTKDKRDIPANKTIIEEYLKDDCRDLAVMVSAFIAEFGFHLTQAGASVKAWEKITNQKAPQTSATFFNTIAPYYFGGRVEAFEAGEIHRDFSIIDINSAYPHAMMHNHPWGESLTIGDELPNSRSAIERSFITLTTKSYGALPWREKRGEKLSFPHDGQIREFKITGWEFFAAKETGCLQEYEISEVISLPLTMNFREYLDHFYQMKTEAKKLGFDKVTEKWEASYKARYEFSKRFLNSLYGKFGANPEEYEEYKTISPRFIEASEMDGYEFKTELGKLVVVGRPINEAQQRFYNVATATSITGFVRAMLWRAIRQCSGVLYCDTDCIFATTIGKSLELDPERLGAWDIEAQCNYGAIAGKKLYAAKTKNGKWKIASKGVKLTPEQIIKVAQGQEILYSPLSPTFSIKRGVGFNPRKIARGI